MRTARTHTSYKKTYLAACLDLNPLTKIHFLLWTTLKVSAFQWPLGLGVCEEPTAKGPEMRSGFRLGLTLRLLCSPARFQPPHPPLSILVICIARPKWSCEGLWLERYCQMENVDCSRQQWRWKEGMGNWGGGGGREGVISIPHRLVGEGGGQFCGEHTFIVVFEWIHKGGGGLDGRKSRLGKEEKKKGFQLLTGFGVLTGGGWLASIQPGLAEFSGTVPVVCLFICAFFVPLHLHLLLFRVKINRHLTTDVPGGPCW